MVSETSAINFGRTRLEYGIRRSSRRKTVAVTIDPEDGVLLTAPEGVTVEKLDDVVRSRAAWILQRLRWVEQPERRPPPREFVSGESFLYLGRSYRLRVRSTAEERGVRLERGFLVVATGEPSRRAVRTQLESWFRERARERLTERVAIWAERIRVPSVGKVMVRAQQKRWASCDSRGNLRFNWRVIGAPIRLVDYVVAHELAHLIHPDHTAEFWALLGRAQPDYERRREDLRRFGCKLEW
jgi:predicted metal-dependent hydrolase